MRQFRVEPRILTSRIFWNEKGKHPIKAMLRARADDYIGGSGQIIDFSADGGKTWIRVANFSPTDAQEPYIAYDGVDTYVIHCGTTVTGNDGMFRSTDSGASFARVTGITGYINYSNDTVVKFEYGAGSKLWASINVAFGDSAKILSSSDDGSTWSTERDDVADGIWTLTSNAAGIMLIESENTPPDGMFDADGVSLPAPTADFAGQGAGWQPAADSPDALYSNPQGSGAESSRFWMTFYNFTADDIRIVYSDDNGSTWKRCVFSFFGDNLPTTSLTEIKWMWDGTNYHFISTGATDYWVWSRDGIFWTLAPAHTQFPAPGSALDQFAAIGHTA